MTSIIIPARNEIYLQKTIENVLSNAEGDIEILAMLDGYVPEPQIITNDCEYDTTMVPTMFNLDVDTWTPKLHKKTNYMYIGNGDGRVLRAEYYNSRQPKNDILIDDTMCCMGPCFFMH